MIVTVEARHHQQLFEQLRRLRQREELPRMHARRHQIIARAFGRAAREHGRFHVDEALLVQKPAASAGDAIAQLQVFLHRRATQVDDAMGQAHVLGDVLIVQLERRRGRDVEYLDFVAQHFDFARSEVRVFRARRTAAHLAGDFQHVFVAYRFGGGKHFGAVRVAHNLR